MSAVRTVAEIGLGVLFGIGAVFNAGSTLRHGDEFYGSFVDGAWFGPGRWIVDRVVRPNAVVFTVLLIAFQVAVATLILSRGELVTAALLAGGVFSTLAALASSPGGTASNLVLAAILFVLVAAH